MKLSEVIQLSNRVSNHIVELNNDLVLKNLSRDEINVICSKKEAYDAIKLRVNTLVCYNNANYLWQDVLEVYEEVYNSKNQTLFRELIEIKDEVFQNHGFFYLLEMCFYYAKSICLFHEFPTTYKIQIEKDDYAFAKKQLDFLENIFTGNPVEKYNSFKAAKIEDTLWRLDFKYCTLKQNNPIVFAR